MTQDVLKKKCTWCDEMVDPTLCFASPIPDVGWMCELCGKQVSFHSLDFDEDAAVERNGLSLPLDRLK
jgi:hypothetical protein